MAFAGFSIFFLLTGIVLLQLIQKAALTMDAVSFSFILYNFSVWHCCSGFAQRAKLTVVASCCRRAGGRRVVPILLAGATAVEAGLPHSDGRNYGVCIHLNSGVDDLGPACLDGRV